MTDNDIIKALEYCLDESKSTCVGCSYYNNVYKSCVIKKDALDLINRQKAEIERAERNFRAAKVDMKLKKAEIEKLTLENLRMVASIKNLKSDAINEFAERLKEKVRHQNSMDFEDIDNLVKEMTERKEIKERF